jgi:ketosteroid isomerase-like protein
MGTVMAVPLHAGSAAQAAWREERIVTQYVPAREPEDLGRFFVRRANEADLEGLMALYEPGAVMATGPGQAVTGTAAIRQELARFLDGTPALSGESQPAVRSGDLALTSTTFEGGATAEVARRQQDGTWLWAVDQPRILST